MAEKNLDALTPREIVAELDKYIVGQKKAKRAVAVALRNRIRRLKLDQETRDDIAPKNILMIGPTGVGKTEIARRLAKLSASPFIKVEATKYTEVGYVGRDVESMIRDLMAAGIQMVKTEMQETVTAEAQKNTEEALLDLLLPGTGKKKESKKKNNPVVKPVNAFSFNPNQSGSGPSIMGATIQLGMPPQQEEAVDEIKEIAEPIQDSEEAKSTREKFRIKLRNGELEDKQVEIMMNQAPQMPMMEMMGGNIDDMMESSLSGIAGLFGGNRKKKLVTIARAREIIMAEESEKLIDRERVSDEARQRVEQTGIVFIDEIDKVAGRGGSSGGPDVSREGVQRDILPIVEGATVNTKWGPVETDHILFIGAGAFNVSKPSDLIPELQGRFPLRVELESLGKEDFLRILTEPKNALTKQYVDLLSTENVEVEFTPGAIERLAALAAEVNSKLENIGARRLHTIMEALLEELSFEAPDIAPVKISITEEYVNERLADLAVNKDLGRYIL
jgi:ATP-dependent HslUV protease ATP-binding subunit HslU